MIYNNSYADLAYNMSWYKYWQCNNNDIVEIYNTSNFILQKFTKTRKKCWHAGLC